MRFAVSAEQRQFAESLHELLARADTPAAGRAWARGEHEPGLKVWRELADLGVPALLVPERRGGLGASATDLVVVFEVLGHHAVPGPLAESVAVAPSLLAPELLPALASGELIASVALPPLVPFALDADVAGVVLRVRDGRTERVEIAEGPVRSVDAARRLFRVEPEGTPLGAAPAEAFELGVLAVSAQLLGAGQWLLERASAYAKQREQYGRPIGSYQAVKHLLADVATRLELARPLVHGAAVAVTGGEAVARDVSAAKVAAGEAAYLAARTALQVHGAIGYTAEHDLGLWLTKVRALTGAWGGAGHHRARVLAALEDM
ncbi:acyl-CoA dehydrogenase family protein [Prauserella cavernicola]|uniref:Acyl-CoA/acyl-ACP dehydrogenase n=1 Tax=Prauserella cavernicola TaxID=2800127 RepID=A0A934QSX7_9PSEU|nr:acyl-CoA dehydrogenase family protein [Prauserella cavernicola]MBK1785930.1 acyl-CoA/acyl-ACP dehydrogenase [Prauserella cavernicola]